MVTQLRLLKRLFSAHQDVCVRLASHIKASQNKCFEKKMEMKLKEKLAILYIKLTIKYTRWVFL